MYLESPRKFRWAQCHGGMPSPLLSQPGEKTPSEQARASVLEVPASPQGSPREGENGKTHTPRFVLTASQTLGTNSQPQN